MHRVRISPFQQSTLPLVRDHDGGCTPTSRNFKTSLYGKPSGFSTSERGTLHRSLKRLIANGMIDDNGRGWCRLTDKGRDWLQARTEMAVASKKMTNDRIPSQIIHAMRTAASRPQPNTTTRPDHPPGCSPIAPPPPRRP